LYFFFFDLNRHERQKYTHAHRITENVGIRMYLLFELLVINPNHVCMETGVTAKQGRFGDWGESDKRRTSDT